jgi:glycosyltransferase involved in cell wall biosynthesis
LAIERIRLRFLEAADAFALPSHLKVSPIPLLKAMAAGLPAISTSVGGMPEMVREGREGFLVLVGDIDALAARIRRLGERADLCAALAGHALETVSAYDLARVVGECRAVLGDCVKVVSM